MKLETNPCISESRDWRKIQFSAILSVCRSADAARRQTLCQDLIQVLLQNCKSKTTSAPDSILSPASRNLTDDQTEGRLRISDRLSLILCVLLRVQRLFPDHILTRKEKRLAISFSSKGFGLEECVVTQNLKRFHVLSSFAVVSGVLVTRGRVFLEETLTSNVIRGDTSSPSPSPTYTFPNFLPLLLLLLLPSPDTQPVRGPPLRFQSSSRLALVSK